MRVGPNPMTGVCIKRGWSGGRHRPTKGEGGVRREAETGASEVPTSQGALAVTDGWRCADFWPWGLWRKTFLLFAATQLVVMS